MGAREGNAVILATEGDGGENRWRPRGLRATPTPAALRRWPVQRVLCCAARLAGAAVDSQRDTRGILR